MTEDTSQRPSEAGRDDVDLAQTPLHDAGERWDPFLSYWRVDGRRAGSWLRRNLQRFRMPGRLARYERPLRIFQDTAYECVGVDFYEATVRPVRPLTGDECCG